MKKQQIAVQGINITVLEGELISLTDIAKKFNEQDPNDLIRNWMRLKDTVELLGAWEMLHNEHFKPVEFDGFKNQAGSNRFTMSPSKWIEATNAIGMSVKRGRYDSGTFAHQDIALAFCSWLSPVFHLYVIKEFQRLKSIENPEWDMRRAIELQRTAQRQLAALYNLNHLPLEWLLSSLVSALSDENKTPENF